MAPSDKYATSNAILDLLMVRRVVLEKQAEGVRADIKFRGEQGMVASLNEMGIQSDEVARAIGEVLGIPVYPYSESLADLGTTLDAPLPGDRPEPKVVLQEGDFWMLTDSRILYFANPLDMQTQQKVISDLQRKKHKMSKLGVVSRRALLHEVERPGAGARMEVAAPTARVAVPGDDRTQQAAYFDELVNKAAALNASDIHLEPMDNEVRVRLRIDGELRKISSVSYQEYSELAGHILNRAKGEPGSNRTPFGGMMAFELASKRRIKLRIEMTPGTLATNESVQEKFTIRLLGNRIEQMNLSDLGIPDMHENPQMLKLRQYSDRKNGLILVTGPTGSGKTVTLSAIQADLLRRYPQRQYYTIEDPVEISLHGVTHVQVNEDAQLTFQRGLKSFLRGDPDVILVGEIRTFEVANLALEASMTGHLVFSTLHTNSAIRTVTRLTNMGCDPYIVADALKMVTAQRLAKKVCTRCSPKVPWGHLVSGEHESLNRPDNQLLKMKLEMAKQLYGDLDFYPLDSSEVRIRGNGRTKEGDVCPSCNGQGYRGRTVISELFEVTPTIEDLINARASSSRILKQALREGFKEMWQHAMYLIRGGMLTFEDADSALGGRDRLGDDPLELEPARLPGEEKISAVDDPISPDRGRALGVKAMSGHSVIPIRSAT